MVVQLQSVSAQEVDPAVAFNQVLRERIAEFFTAYRYDERNIHEVKQRLYAALEDAKTEFTTATLHELLLRMEEYYPTGESSTAVHPQELAAQDNEGTASHLAVSSSIVVDTAPVGGAVRAAVRITTTNHYQLNAGYIDISVLEQTRLDRVNGLRGTLGRTPLSLHPALDKTAADRSETMKSKGTADHRRFADSGYYDYGDIEQWFRERGVTFVNISRATFTENVGRATFRCTDDECTDEAVEALRTVFDFYVREEGTKSDAHRRTLIHPLFGVVGFGIAVDQSADKLYVTTHYGTQIQ